MEEFHDVRMEQPNAVVVGTAGGPGVQGIFSASYYALGQ